MFGRKRPLSGLSRASAIFWPKSGFRRAGLYLWRRVERIKGSPHAIAAGVASGAAVSFLPLPGLHFFLGAFLAWSLRGSIIASAIGTVVGNPWTFPVIWIAGYRIGAWLGFGVERGFFRPRIGEVLSDAADKLWDGRVVAAVVESWPVLKPTLVGGAIMGAVVFGVFYFIVRKAAAAYQARRRAKLEAGRARQRRLHAAPERQSA